MVQVYSWHEIREGRFAQPATIHHAVQDGMKLFESMHKKGWIVSAGFYGSAARGDATIGSDVDALVIAHPKHEAKVMRLWQRATSESLRKYGVEPNVNVITLPEAQNGLHTIGENFRRHIMSNWRPDASVGIHPKEILKPLRVPILDEVIRQQANYLRKLREYRSKKRLPRSTESAEERKNEMLSDMCTRYVHILRATLDALNTLPKKGGKTVDSKQAVIDAYRALGGRGPGPEANDALVEIGAAVYEYRKALEFAADANTEDALALPSDRHDADETIEMARKAHARTVDGLEDALPAYETLLKSNLNFLTRVRDHPEEFEKR